jgi:hypothetical protein
MMESLMACGRGLTIRQGKEHNAAWAAICVSHNRLESCDRNPSTTEQGINSTLQGIMIPYQGICVPENGAMSEVTWSRSSSNIDTPLERIGYRRFVRQ